MFLRVRKWDGPRHDGTAEERLAEHNALVDAYRDLLAYRYLLEKQINDLQRKLETEKSLHVEGR